jgi:hypothetical protein
MTPAQIEGMIDRICGLFPSGQVSLAKAKHAWTADDFLLLQDVNDARKVIPIILENHDKFPNLKDVQKAFRHIRQPAKQMIVLCDICDGNGWDTGRRWDYATKTLISEGFTKIVFDRPYSYVVRCQCRKFEAA